jgi:hypothetical protein
MEKLRLDLSELDFEGGESITSDSQVNAFTGAQVCETFVVCTEQMCETGNMGVCGATSYTGLGCGELCEQPTYQAVDECWTYGHC